MRIYRKLKECKPGTSFRTQPLDITNELANALMVDIVEAGLLPDDAWMATLDLNFSVERIVPDATKPQDDDE